MDWVAQEGKEIDLSKYLTSLSFYYIGGKPLNKAGEKTYNFDF